MIEPKGNEKRKYERVPLQSIVFYSIEKSPGEKKPMDLLVSQTPLSVDLSEGGMKILAMQDIPAGTNLKIVLTFYETRIPIDLKGTVSWSEATGTGQNHHIGIQFQGLTDAKKNILKKYIQLQSEKDKD